MSALVEWVRFQVDADGHRSGAELVKLTEDQAKAAGRDSYHSLTHAGTELVALEYGAFGAMTRLVLLHPSTPAGERTRDAELGVELRARFVLPRPPRPAPSPVVARLRELADALDALELPAHASIDVYLTVEGVDRAAAADTATALIPRLATAYLETTQLSVAVHTRHEDADACVELVFPEAPAGARADTELAGLGAS